MSVILMLSVLLVGLIIQKFLPGDSKKKAVIGCGVILFLFGALRSTSVGIDIDGYVSYYKAVQDMSFSEILSSRKGLSRDYGFYFSIKILSIINSDPQLMLIVVSAVVAVCFSIYIYKYSPNPILSFIVFIGLRYYFFTLSGLRQAIAWAIVVLTFKLIEERKPIKYCIVVIFASFFHGSVLIFLLAYPFARIGKKYILFVTAASSLLLYYLPEYYISELFVETVIFSNYIDYFNIRSTSSGLSMIIVYIIVILVALSMKKVVLINDKNTMMFNCLVFGTVVTILNFKYPNIFRVGLYFVSSIIILLPVLIKHKRDKNLQIMLNSIVVILLIVQIIIFGAGAGTDRYSFFWQ